MAQTPLNAVDLVNTMRTNPNLPVVFTLDDLTISQGYHITEVKHAMVDSLDCGQGTDQWSELVIQLLDGHADSDSGFMPAAKFLGILDKALPVKPQDEQATLYFEFAPRNTALQKTSVQSIDVVDGNIFVSLSGSPAVCKPYQRALESGTASDNDAGCCGSATDTKSAGPCCQGGIAKATGSPCCS